MKSSTSPQFLDRLLADLETSGLSVAAFARDRGIPAHRLYWARRNRRYPSEPAPEDFQEVHVPDTLEHGPGIELRLPCGASIHVRRGFDEDTLQRILAVIDPC